MNFNLKKLIFKRLDKNYLNFIAKQIEKDNKNLIKNNNSIIKTKLFLLILGFNSYKYKNIFWKSFILSLSKDENLEKYHLIILKYLKKNKLETQTLSDLNILLMISYRCGFFRLGHFIRNRIILKTFSYLRVKNPKQIYIKSSILALIEIRQYKISQNLLIKVKDEIFRSLISEFIKKIKDNNFEIKLFSNFYSKKFNNLLKNKSIIIEGPTDIRTELEIKKYDLVIKLNFFFPKDFKENCNISYLNSEQSNFYQSEKFDNRVDYFVTRDKNSAKAMNETNPNLNFRYTYNFKKLLFRGNVNLIPNTILDLFFCNSKQKSINIAKSDLMITVNRSKNYYPNIWNRETRMKEIFLESAAISHDPITQYRLLKNFYLIDFVNGDNLFNAVMNDGLKSYLKKLEKTYSIKN